MSSIHFRKTPGADALSVSLIESLPSFSPGVRRRIIESMLKEWQATEGAHRAAYPEGSGCANCWTLDPRPKRYFASSMSELCGDLSDGQVSVTLQALSRASWQWDLR